MTRMSRFLVALVVSAAALMLPACAGGSTTSNIDTQTEGQRLLDLRKALDEGAISQDEYDRERREILRE
jgi:hypothetical protein